MVAVVRTKNIFKLVTLIGLTSVFVISKDAPNIAQQVAPSNDLKAWENSLKNSQWVGTYKLPPNTYATNLQIKSVSSGFIGGVITHKNSAGAFLQVKVAGDIIPQYLVDVDGDNNAEWVDRDQFTPETLDRAVVKEQRLIIRLKRFRALDIKSGSDRIQWHQNREYRLRLIEGKISGSVGIPPRNYGDGAGTIEEGSITLRRV